VKQLKENVSREEYNRILKSIELQQIVLESAKLSTNYNSVQINKLTEVEIDLDEKLKTQVKDKNLIGSHSFKIVAKKTKTKDIIFKIECTFSCIFTYKIQPSKKFLKEFEKRNLRIFTIPYIREFVHSMSLKMGLPPLVLPLYKKT